MPPACRLPTERVRVSPTERETPPLTARWEGTSTSPSFSGSLPESGGSGAYPRKRPANRRERDTAFRGFGPLQGGIPQVFQHGGVGNLRVLGLGLDKGGVHGIEGDVPIPVLILGTDDQEVEQRGPEGGHNGHQAAARQCPRW